MVEMRFAAPCSYSKVGNGEETNERTNERRMGIRLARAISELALKDKDRIGGPNRDRGLAMGGGREEG